MPTTPAGPIAEPISEFKTLLASLATFQTFAGPDYADRIHENENRLQIEEPTGELLYLNQTLDLPFAMVWIEELLLEPHLPCAESCKLMLMFQAAAADRRDHTESHITFTTLVGNVVRELAESVTNYNIAGANISRIFMASSPTRVAVTRAGSQSDYWTATFEIMLGSGGR